MPEEELPSEIRNFISGNLRSLEQLEILLLLSSKPEVPWTVQAVYEIIVSSKPSVERWLEDFVRLGFFEKTTDFPPIYRFAVTGELAATIETLANLYKTKPVRIIEAIFKKDRDPAQSFADAFKLRKPQ
jgi:hypothetical protein